jgi:hypothetical protein
MNHETRTLLLELICRAPGPGKTIREKPARNQAVPGALAFHARPIMG